MLLDPSQTLTHTHWAGRSLAAAFAHTDLCSVGAGEMDLLVSGFGRGFSWGFLHHFLSVKMSNSISSAKSEIL